MKNKTKTLCRLFFSTLCALALLPTAQPASAQSSTGAVRGTVTDPSGALVPQAAITLSNGSGFTRTLKSTAAGAFETSRLVPGRYSLRVDAKGFSTAVLGEVMVFADKVTSQDVKLEISLESEVVVTADTTGVSTNPDDNANATVIKGKDLDALSDDPDDLQNELTALAGPAAGPSGAQIYIDGFTGGQLPPKSSIREIRINRNPFSAQYDKLGYGRIEILTKPGTDKLRGSVMVNGNTKQFNSLNPFVKSEPDYHTLFLNGSIGGSLNSKASWFASVFDRNNASNSILNATLPTGYDTSFCTTVAATNSASNTCTAAVPNPQSRLDISPRFDFQLGATNTLSVRYMFDRQKATNNGVSGLALPTQAYNSTGYEHTLQISDTQVLSQRVVNETRLQYTAARNSQTPTSTTPTINVQGSFIGGGNSAGNVQNNQDRFEFQDYVTAAEGRHALNFGTRLRLTHEVDTTNAGFNGTFIYQSLSDYVAGKASEYDVTAGTAAASVNLFDASLFFQDDWTVKPNLTVSFGARYEGQNRIGDHMDFAPRVAVSWAPPSHNGKKSSTVFRAGYGWFYDRFGATYVLDAIHANGINQKNYVVKNPTFTPTSAPTASALAASSTAAPTLYSVSPNLKTAVNMQAAFGIDHQFGKLLTLSATYINSRGVHQYLSDNINAFIPTTYNVATGTGIRPNGINENIYQFQSGGVYNQNQLMLNYNLRAKKVTLFGFYNLGFANADTSGATYFPTNQNNPGADYGRASFDVRNRFLMGGNYIAPFGVSVSPFLVVNSGSPFNITVGQDLNGDNQYNDRPSFASATSTNTKATAYGTFDLSPSANAQRIAYNSQTGPGQWSLNMRVSKSFGLGPRVEGNSGGGFPGGGGPGGPGGGGPGGGGPPGGGLGPGGLSGNGGPPRLDANVPRRYSLTISAMGRNVFNHVSLANPIGVLSSDRFGQSTSIAGGFFGNAAANRSVDLQMSFNF